MWPQSEAVVALRVFLQRRPEAVLTPLGDERNFMDAVAARSFVVVQEWSRQLDHSFVSRVSICLSIFPRIKIPIRGKKIDPFSGKVVLEFVRCTQGHIFERAYIQAWSRQHGGNICPFGNQHPLMSPGGNFDVHVWGDDVRGLFTDFMIEKFSAERVAGDVIEANSRALNDMIPYCRNEDIRSEFQKILGSVKESALPRL